MKRTTVALATVGLLATATPAVASTSAIDWRPCGPPHSMECGTIDVPAGLTLDLARLPATGARKGTVLYAPGGPGKDGIQQLRDSAETLAALRRHFDVVAFDTRQTLVIRDLAGSCATALPLLAEPRDREEFDRQAARQRAAFEKCAAEDATGLFRHADADAVAGDMDAIRAALGERRITVISESYGGITAAAYARRFPQRIRAMHLDGTPDHTTAELDYAVAAGERMLGRFAAWCAEDRSCALHGQDVHKVWRGLIRRVDRDPVPVSSPRFGSGHLTGMHLQTIGYGMAVNTRGDQWKPFADAIAEAMRGDFAFFGEQVLGLSYHGTQPRAVAPWCGDGFGITSYDQYAKLRRDLDRQLPDLGRNGLWAALMCSGWPYRPANPPGPLPVTRLPRLLGTGTWSDFDMTDRLVRKVPGSVTIRYEGFGHVLYVSGTSRCVADHVVRYVETLDLPPQGTVCRPGE
ncbi:alpha/beta fold hydrolase [Nonomuraea sp. SYSU D8015]|uniref:alpha/beta fold hydrolase n=1 Tax=Nonomuraea sp. SYSU D8015 TaxID=2593644 RepID=UPI0016606A79|nr:alpha/beta fold hydrolase [Nonomuraea sp. SYSU D8015]